jgi:hypothetical protein
MNTTCPAIDSWLGLLLDEVVATEREGLEAHLDGPGSRSMALAAFAERRGLDRLIEESGGESYGAGTLSIPGLATARTPRRPGDPPGLDEAIGPPVIPGVVELDGLRTGGDGLP